jgi:hypothetical protein
LREPFRNEIISIVAPRQTMQIAATFFDKQPPRRAFPPRSNGVAIALHHARQRDERSHASLHFYRLADYVGVADLGVHKHLARAHLAKSVSSLIFDYAHRGLLISKDDVAHHRFPMGTRQIPSLGAMFCDFE